MIIEPIYIKIFKIAIPLRFIDNINKSWHLSIEDILLKLEKL